MDTPQRKLAALRMSRTYPERTRLDHRIRMSPPAASELQAIASLLADFYARADRVAFAPARYLARLERSMAENRAGLAAQ